MVQREDSLKFKCTSNLKRPIIGKNFMWLPSFGVRGSQRQLPYIYVLQIAPVLHHYSNFSQRSTLQQVNLKRTFHCSGTFSSCLPIYDKTDWLGSESELLLLDYYLTDNFRHFRKVNQMLPTVIVHSRNILPMRASRGKKRWKISPALILHSPCLSLTII